MVERQSMKVAGILPPTSERWGNILLAAGFASGLGAAGSIAEHFHIAGLVFFILNRFLMALGLRNAADQMRSTGIALAAISLGAVAFGFALDDMGHALAASFFLVGLLVESAFRIPEILSRPRTNGFAREDIFTIAASAAFATACIWPNAFGFTAYASGVLGFVAAGVLIGARMEKA